MKPILFEIPIPSFFPSWLGGGESLLFPSYYVMLSISLMLGIVIGVRYAEKSKLNVNKVLDVSLAGIIGILLGMRLFYVIQKWDQFLWPFSWRKFWEIFKIWEGGLVLYGGILGALILGVIWCFIKKVPVLKMMDIAAMPVGVGMFFTRIGCTLNGCCHGKLTLVPWGITYPPDSIVFNYHKGKKWILATDPASLPVHPSQLYEGLMGLVIFFFLIWFWKRKKFDGQVFFIFALIYPVQRFLIEFTRGDPARGFVGFLSTSQFVSVFFFAWALLMYLFLSKRAKRVSAKALAESFAESSPPTLSHPAKPSSSP